MKSFSIIVAMDKNRGIGKAGTLAWHLPTDMKYFQKITKGEYGDMNPSKVNAVVMGRKTWDSIPAVHRPLKGRVNIILSNTLSNQDVSHLEQTYTTTKFDDVLTCCDADKRNQIEDIFIIGGATLYNEAIKHPLCDKLYITKIDAVFDCDTFFPEFSKADFKEVSRSEPVIENGVKYSFVLYKKFVQL